MNISNEKLKSTFTSAANALTAFYKTCQTAQQESYTQGQKDALNELVQYILKESGGDPRKLTTSKLIEYVDAKVGELQAQIPQNNLPMPSPSTSVNTEFAHQFDLGGMSPMPSWQHQQDSNTQISYHTQGNNLFANESFLTNQNQGPFQGNNGLFGNNQSNTSYFQ